MIVRSSRKNRFTVINNDLIEDPSIDWKDLGMLVYLLSKPDNWEISTGHLMKERKTSRDGVYSILKNLCNAGYVSKKPKPEGGWIWFVYDEKQSTNPDTDFPDTDFPDTDFPDTDFPHPENPTLINTEYKQELTTTVLPPNHPDSSSPDDALKWVEFFVNKKGFQFHDAQNVGTMLMFREWVKDGVTVDDVELASIEVLSSLAGNRPCTPKYYKKFVEKVIREKQKSQLDRAGSEAGFPKNKRGDYDTKAKARPKPCSGFAERYPQLLSGNSNDDS